MSYSDIINSYIASRSGGNDDISMINLYTDEDDQPIFGKGDNDAELDNIFDTELSGGLSLSSLNPFKSNKPTKKVGPLVTMLPIMKSNTLEDVVNDFTNFENFIITEKKKLNDITNSILPIINKSKEIKNDFENIIEHGSAIVQSNNITQQTGGSSRYHASPMYTIEELVNAIHTLE